MHKTRNIVEKIRFEFYRTDKRGIISFPLILLFLGIFARWVCGSPLATLHFLGVKSIVPPSWLMVLLFSASYIVAGLSLGIALGSCFCPCGEKKYQGAMWFTVALALGYAWYPIFFCARLFLVSVIVCALCLFASILSTVCFASVSRLSLFFGIIYDCFLLYLLLLNMQIFFTI